MSSDQLQTPIPVLDVNGATLVVLSGEIDMANVENLEEALASIPATPPRQVTVDLSDVNFLGVCGVNALLGAAVRLRASGSTVALLHASPLTRKVVGVLGLEQLLTSVKEHPA